MFARVIIVVFLAAFLWAVLARDTGAGPPQRFHSVRTGDTLWSIAEASYAGDPREGVWKLQRKNRLDGATIVPGQRLALP
jgi:nucleoid-associated protein YgaU